MIIYDQQATNKNKQVPISKKKVPNVRFMSIGRKYADQHEGHRSRGVSCIHNGYCCCKMFLTISRVFSNKPSAA